MQVCWRIIELHLRSEGDCHSSLWADLSLGLKNPIRLELEHAC